MWISFLMTKDGIFALIRTRLQWHQGQSCVSRPQDPQRYLHHPPRGHRLFIWGTIIGQSFTVKSSTLNRNNTCAAGFLWDGLHGRRMDGDATEDWWINWLQTTMGRLCRWLWTPCRLYEVTLDRGRGKFPVSCFKSTLGEAKVLETTASMYQMCQLSGFNGSLTRFGAMFQKFVLLQPHEHKWRSTVISETPWLTVNT